MYHQQINKLLNIQIRNKDFTFNMVAELHKSVWILYNIYSRGYM